MRLFAVTVVLMLSACNCGDLPISPGDENSPHEVDTPEGEEVERPGRGVIILDPIFFDFSDAGSVEDGQEQGDGGNDAGPCDSGADEDEGPLDDDDSDSDSEDDDDDSDDVLPESEDDEERGGEDGDGPVDSEEDEDCDDDSDSDSDESSEEEGDHERVCLCHKGRKTLCLPEPAVDGHLGHGDSLGECD